MTSTIWLSEIIFGVGYPTKPSTTQTVTRMTLFHTLRGTHWHMSRYCPRVATVLREDMRPYQRDPDAIPERQRCSRCWRTVDVRR